MSILKSLLPGWSWVETNEQADKIVTYVDKLDTRAKYDLYTGLRGPDIRPQVVPSPPSPAGSVKGVITGRLRAIVFPLDVRAIDSRGIIVTDKLSHDELVRNAVYFESLTIENEGHYINHLNNAVRATYDHPIWGGGSVFLCYYLFNAHLYATRSRAQLTKFITTVWQIDHYGKLAGASASYDWGDETY